MIPGRVSLRPVPSQRRSIIIIQRKNKLLPKKTRST